jgi:hypothetical protein
MRVGAGIPRASSGLATRGCDGANTLVTHSARPSPVPSDARIPADRSAGIPQGWLCCRLGRPPRRLSASPSRRFFVSLS